ncbi:MAG: phytanoyl-CoA dioxygenase family protein [Lautropia sp.]
MPPALLPEQVRAYKERGYFAPLKAIGAEEARMLRATIENHERKTGGPLKPAFRQKTHLLFTELADLIRSPSILDAVECLLGPNILCLNASFFIKEAHDPAFVSWHQDATYWGLSSTNVVTAWVSFNGSNRENGCVRVIPGTHRGQLPHKETRNDANMLTRGQEIEVDVDGREAVDLVLLPGEFSLHHVLIAHSSEPNDSDDRRMGYAIRYMPTAMRQLSELREYATLVRGVDEHRNFEPEQRPIKDLDSAALAEHAKVMKRHEEIVYAGSTATRYSEKSGAR